MELEKGIYHILDGNAIVIMGAGASYGAQNSSGRFPIGTDLARELYKECGMSPTNMNDLQDAAQCYEEKFSAEKLVEKLKNLLTCKSFTEAHEIIYGLNWMRLYTTNYDDVAVLAAKKNGIEITQVTLSDKVKKIIEKPRVCVHINGNLKNLNENTLHNEFKLTLDSYMSQNHILTSEWGELLANDLITAKCIVIIGLSLVSDLDLSRILYNENLRKKTMFIDSHSLDEDSERRLRRYGTVYKIGIDDFAGKIKDIKNTYSPVVCGPEEKIYTGFLYRYHYRYNKAKPTAEDAFELFLKGEYSDAIYYQSTTNAQIFIKQNRDDVIKSNILGGKKIVFIESDMGNGKTACINGMLYALSGEDVHIFMLKSADSTMIDEEIASITTLADSKRVLIVIDDYTNYMEIVHKIALLDRKNLQLMLTARTALNKNKMPTVLMEFGIAEDESAIFNVNAVDDVGITNCLVTFGRYGLFGKRAGLKVEDKKKYLVKKSGCGRRFQAITLDLLESEFMKKKVEELLSAIEESSKSYHHAVIVILLIKIMNLRLSIDDVERMLNMNISSDARFRSDPAIKELVSFGDDNEITVKSSITARYILQNVASSDDIIDSLMKVAKFAQNYSESEKYSQVLISIVSYAHISSFLRKIGEFRETLQEYYNTMGELKFYQENNFFWLQYAIGCIELNDFQRAEKYLDTAYGLIPKGFVPFQINNQMARLYLERIIAGKSSSPIVDFKKAHELLMKPIESPKDNEEIVIRLFGYYNKAELVNVLKKTKDGAESYKASCKEAFNRVESFIKSHPSYRENLGDLRGKLLKSYVS